MRVYLKKNIPAFSLGMAAVFIQVVLLREVLVIFKGLEFSLAIGLFIWLLGSTLGAALIPQKKLPFNYQKYLFIFTLLFIGSSFTFLYFIRLQYPLLLFTRQDLPELLFLGILLLLPASLSLGILFPTIVSLQFPQDAHSEGVRRIYLLETLGSFAGGIILYFYLLRFFCHQQILLLALLTLTLAGYILSLINRKFFIIILIALTILVIFPIKLRKNFVYSGTNSHSLPGKVETYWTPYGRFDRISQNGSLTFSLNGLVQSVFPDHYSAELHYLLPIAVLGRHGKTLLLRGNPAVIYSEPLPRTIPDTLYWVEPNRFLQRLYFSGDKLQKLDRQLHLRSIPKGPRGYLASKNKTHYDLIIMHLSPPATLVANAYYTEEFFQSVGHALSDSGAFYFTLPAAENILSPQLSRFLGNIKRTAELVFQYVEILPGSEAIFFCSNRKPPEPLYRMLINLEDYCSWQPTTLNQTYWLYRLSEERLSEFNAALSGIEDGPLNTDRNFLGFTRYIQTLPLPVIRQLGMIIESLIPRRFLLAGIILGLLLMTIFLIRPERRVIAGLLANGLLCMSLETLGLILYQIQYGNIYQETALFIGAFMGGMALGVHFFSGFSAGVWGKILLRSCYSFIAVILFLLFNLNIANGPILLVQAAFTFIFILSGFSGGFWFAALSKEFTTGGKAPGRSYAFDLLGAALGAFLFTTLLLPILGIELFLLILAGTNLIIFTRQKIS